MIAAAFDRVSNFLAGLTQNLQSGTEPSPKGAVYPSLGRKPQVKSQTRAQGLKARYISPALAKYAASRFRSKSYLVIFFEAVKDLLSPHGPQASRQKSAKQEATQQTCSGRCRQ
jgi:hypothetical protein